MLTKKALTKFIEEYISEYRRFVEESYSKRKDLFPLFNSYPMHVIAFLSPTATLIEYVSNVPKFAIQIDEVRELPKLDRKTKHYIGAFRNDYLLKIIKEAKKVARQDVSHAVADYDTYEESQKELAEYYERQYAEYIDDQIKYTVKGYDSYIASAYEVRSETLSRYEAKIYDVVKIIDSVRGYLTEALLIATCEASFDVIDEVVQDVESSLFLAMHGKYVPANALLRRILENTLTALYFDSEIGKCKVGSRTHRDLCERRDTWVEKSKKGNVSFTSDYGILGRLIDPDTDYIARKILGQTNPNAPQKFRKYILNIYGDLCKFVHYGGPTLVERFSLEFARFDEKKFEEWVCRFRQVFEIYSIVLAVKFPQVLLHYEKLIGTLETFEQIHLLTPKQEETFKEETKNPA